MNVTRSLIIALAVACLLPAPAGAATPRLKERGALSPLLARLAKPAVRSQSHAKQAAIIGVARDGPGSLVREGRRVLVKVRFDHGAIGSRNEIRDAGGLVLDASRRYQSATAAVRAADLPSIASLPTVAAVTPIRSPLISAVDCEGGSVISEGNEQLGVLPARAKFGVEGEGVTVGALSDSYDEATEAPDGSGPIATKAADDILTADLPGAANTCVGQSTAVDLLEDLPSEIASDEGRAMLQTVHDVAPKASLAFATAFGGEEVFAQNIEALAGAGAEVIVDDVTYFEEPFFQDGPVAAAVDAAAAAEVVYLSAAGNNNLFDGEENEIGSWEAPAYRDSGNCPAAIRSIGGLNGSHCLDFHPGADVDRTFGIKVKSKETLSVDLQWAEPRNGVGTDIDAFLIDAGGNLLTTSTENNVATGEPIEIIQWTNSSGGERTVQLVVNRFSGPDPRLKFILLQNGGELNATEYPRSGGGDVVGPTVFGHAAAAGAIALGAVFFFNSEPEEYSSRGPVTHYFGPVEGATPAPELPEPETISKPDIAATDCGATTFFAQRFDGVTWRFCGTSAAAPHAAGVAALLRDIDPLATSAELRAAMTGTAATVGLFGPCVVGGGRVDALAAGEGLSGEIPVVEPGTCSPPDGSGEVSVAPGFWGLEDPPPPPPPPPTNPGPSPAPETRIQRHPPKLVRTRGRSVRLVFRFGSDQAGVTFLCKVDRGPFAPCAAQLARRFAIGSHAVRVQARTADGQVDPTPAVFSFRVKRIS
jgi:subtilisin family serine protease